MFSETTEDHSSEAFNLEKAAESFPDNPDAGWQGEIKAADRTYEMARQALDKVRQILHPDLVQLFEQEIEVQHGIIEDAKTIPESEDEDALLEIKLRLRPPQRDLTEIWSGLSVIENTIRSLNREPEVPKSASE
jgi:hypothetical protein